MWSYSNYELKDMIHNFSVEKKKLKKLIKKFPFGCGFYKNELAVVTEELDFCMRQIKIQAR